MVDRLINKVENPPPEAYRVKSTAETRKDKQHEEQTPEEKAAQFERASKTGSAWQKFGGQRITIKPIRVQGVRVAALLFRHAVWNKGTSMLIVDIKWKDGRITEGAVVKLKGIDDYLRARRLNTGNQVPEDMWFADEIEFGVPVILSQSGLHETFDTTGTEVNNTKATVLEKGWLSTIYNRALKSLRWEIVVVILTAAATVVLILLYAMR